MSKSDQKYLYIGKSGGVGGLRHHMTDSLAEQLGVTEILAAAVKNGNYKKVSKWPKLKTETEDQPPADDQPGEDNQENKES